MSGTKLPCGNAISTSAGGLGTKTMPSLQAVATAARERARDAAAGEAASPERTLPVAAATDADAATASAITLATGGMTTMEFVRDSVSKDEESEGLCVNESR